MVAMADKDDSRTVSRTYRIYPAIAEDFGRWCDDRGRIQQRVVEGLMLEFLQGNPDAVATDALLTRVSEWIESHPTPPGAVPISDQKARAAGDEGRVEIENQKSKRGKSLSPPAPGRVSSG